MSLLVSVNLYGLLGSDGLRVTNLLPHPILANGLCTAYGNTYLGDWSDIHVLDREGHLKEKLPTKAVNIHTLRTLHDRFLIASTADHKVVWGDEVIFHPKEFDIPPRPPYGYYVNSAIPWQDDIILIGLRSHRAVVFFDVEARHIERVIELPFLRNLHHPTPYTENLFLVSDDSSVVLFDIEGHPILRSPDIRWPRGIYVESPTRVFIADRHGISRWNPRVNEFEKRIESPLYPPNSLPERKEDVTAGAFFDIAPSS